ncbi:MAG TPA: sensor domain-containing diguanylate cyclase [Longimicrobiales bacterium]
MQEQRYTALLEASRLLETSVGPALFFSALHDCLRNALRSSAFLAGLYDGTGPIHAVYRDGDTRGCMACVAEVLDRLRDGETVVVGAAGASYLAAPLLRDGRFLGCFIAARDDAGFSAEDAAFLGAVARIAAAAVDGAWLAVIARRRGDEIVRLDAAARDLGASLELEEVVQRVADHANALVEKPIVVWLIENERARAAARAGGALVRLGEERALSPSEEARIVQSAQSLREALDIVDHDERSIAVGLEAHDTGSVRPDPSLGGTISVPLMLGQRLVGFLAVGPWVDDAPDREKLRLLLRMAPYAAAAVENARMHAELRELSLTDPLVQLPNRRQLDLFLEREFAAATRGRALCFVLFDLDHFKAYNDTFGHREGDVALMRFARVLREETRSMNLAARYGGEEFATVLSGTGRAGGKMHAERIRRRVLRETNGRLSVSAGVAEYRPGMKSPIELVVAADQALYRAKTEGRNRVCVAGD